MARQIEPRLGEPRIAILDRRLAELELRIALLAEAVQMLIGELQSQLADGGGRPGDGDTRPDSRLTAERGRPDDVPGQFAGERGRPAVRRAAELLLECQRRGTGHPA